MYVHMYITPDTHGVAEIRCIQSIKETRVATVTSQI